MNNFHGTINNATISTFRVEDVRITNGDQGTFLNTDGYSPLNVYTSDFTSGTDGWFAKVDEGTADGNIDGISDGTTSKDDVLRLTLSGGAISHSVRINGVIDLGNVHDVSFEYYIPSGQTVDGISFKTSSGTDGSYQQSVVATWTSVTISDWSITAGGQFRVHPTDGGSFTVDGNDDVFYLKNIVVTQPNVYVPRLKDNTTDVLGNPLTYKGQVAQPLSLVNSNGAYLETPHKVDFSQIDVSDFTLTFYAYLDSSLAGSGTNREILSNKNTTQGLLYFSDARLYYYAGGYNGSYNFSSHIPDEEVVDKWQKFSIIRNDSANTLSFVVENDSRTVTTDPAQSGAVAPYNMIGRMYSAPGLGGSLAWVSLHSKAMTIEEARAINPYNMDTDSLEIFLVPSAGNGSTVFDVSGNNNHGTITNATLSDFWIKQDQFHWNLKKGFSEVYAFDGVDDDITLDTPLAFAGDFFIDFDVIPTSNDFYIASSGGEYLRFSAGSLLFRIDSNLYTITTGITTNTRYIGRLQRTDGVITCIVNETEYPVVTSTTRVDIIVVGASFGSGYGKGIINSININGEYSLIGIVETGDSTTINGGLQSVKVPYTINGNYTNPAGKWHNDAETQVNFPHTAKLHMINEQFDYKPFFYKNAQLEDATAAYSMRKVIGDYEGPLVNVIRSSDLQAQDFYPDSRGDLDTTAITNFVNESGPVLDDYAGAVSAYSLRKVRTAYTGDAIEVRRSSDGGTQDIGFDANGDLDTTALLAFVNADVEKVVNGDFATDSNWTKGTGWTISGGTANCDGTQTGLSEFKTEVGIAIQNMEVAFSFEVKNYSAGTLSATVEGTGALEFSGINANGVYSATATSSDSLPRVVFTASSDFVGSIDDVSVIPINVDGAVTTWYDQAGSNNATQSNPAEMPLIVSAGALVTENGKAALLGDLKQLDVAAAVIQDTFDIFAICNIDDECYIVDMREGDVNGTMILGRRSVGWLFNGSSWLGNGASISTGTQILANFEVSPTSATYHENGASVETISHSVNTSANEGFRIDFLSSETLQIQELIIFNSDQSTNRTGIESNIGRYYNIDGFTDGRVATWYDQANANHATQSTPDKQPLIVSDGALVLKNSKPAIDFDGVDDVLGITTGPTILPSTGDISSFSVFSGDTSVSGYIYSNRTSANDRHGLGVQFFSGALRINGAIRIGGTWSIYEEQLITADQQYLLSAFKSDVDLYVDGTKSTGALNGLFATDSNNFNIGSNTNGSSSLNGKLQEMIFYASDQTSNRQDIEKNIADYYEITLSGNSGVESWVKNVSFADMYQIWFDYEYLHRLFANFEIPNQVHKILAYSDELTADQKQQVYDYLQKNYHPIYTAFSTRVLADGGTVENLSCGTTKVEYLLNNP
jgi:hypothetical protein